MKVIFISLVCTLFLTNFALAQFDGPDYGAGSGSGPVTITVSFSAIPSNNCMIELRDNRSGESLGRQTCDTQHTQFQGVPRGEYALVVEQGMDELRQDVTAQALHTNVTFSLPAARQKNEVTSRATVSLKEMLIPGKAQKLLSKADESFTRSKLEDARKYVTEALQIAPAYARASALQAVIAMSTNDRQSALASANNAVQSDPQLPYAQFVRAAVLNSLGKFQEARAAAEQGLRTDAASWQGHFELAQAFNGLNDTEHALQEANKAESAAPQHFFPVHLLRAFILVRSKAVSEAARELQELDGGPAAKDPRVQQLHQLLASVQLSR
jgi:tetratricopeptide (TPR) repeat protein